MRRHVAVLLLVSSALSCAPSLSKSPRAQPVPAACTASALPACEEAIARALREGAATNLWVESYLAARATALGTTDGWVVLGRRLQGLSRASSPPVVMGARATVEPIAAELKATYRELRPADLSPVVLEPPELPELRGMDNPELLLAMARSARLGVIAWVRAQDVVVVLGDEPLAPLIYNMAPLWRESKAEVGGGSALELARLLTVERGATEVMRLLAALQFREAAVVLGQLDPVLDAMAPTRASGLRARLLAARRGLFGMEKASSGPERHSPRAPEAGAASDATSTTQGAYAAWLRTLLARSEDKDAWKRQRALVSGGVSAARLAAMDFVYDHDARSAGPQRCDAEAGPIPADLLGGELLFANKLAQLATRGVLTPVQWAKAYDAMVGRVEQTRTGWYMLSSLLFQRGELPGMATRGSAQYRRVTRLALDHLEALRRFQQSAPASYHPSGQLIVSMSPGAASDPELLQVLQELLSDSVHHKLAPARKSKEVLEQVLLGAVSALSLPEPMRSAYLQSVVRELDARLKGELQQQAGWDVALLYALGALGHHLTGSEPELAFAGDQIARALESDSSVPVRPLAAVTARAVQYAALGVSGELEPDKIGTAPLGPRRMAARDSLRSSLRLLGGTGAPVPEPTLQALTTLMDGLIVSSVIAAGEPAPKPAGQRACLASGAAGRPQVFKNLHALARVRDQLSKDRALWQAREPWSRRAGLIVVLLSDLLDLMMAPEGAKRSSGLSDAQASRALRAGLSEWSSPELSEGAAALHTLVRAGMRDKAGWKRLPDDHPAELASALRGAFSLMGSHHSTLGELAVRTGLGMLAQPSKADAPPGTIASYAEALYAAGHPDEGAVALLLSSAANPAGPSAERAEAIGRQHDSPVTWALASRRLVQQTGPGAPLDASGFERSLRMISDDRCKSAQVEPVVAAGHAVARFAAGDQEGAARALDALLGRAQTQGWVVPRVQYRLSEQVAEGKVGKLEVQLTSAQGFVSENAFSLGLELFSDKRPSGLRVDVVPTQSEDAGRFYAHIASLAAVYHFLQGHDSAGAYGAVRALEAIATGVKLGTRSVAPSSRKWAEDSADALLLLYELALERNQPLLAAALMVALPQGYEPAEGSPQAVGLRALQGISERMNRAGQDLALLRKARSCDGTGARRAPPATDCAQLRRAIALWRAGAWSHAPTLRAGRNEGCSDELSLIAILEPLGAAGPATGFAEAWKGKLAKWTSRAVESGYAHDSLTVLRAARDAGVCAPALVATARLAARRSALTAAHRVDWLTYALTCPGRALDEATWDDLSKLGDAADGLTDPAVALRVDAAVVRFMAAQQAWGRLHAFASRPAFLEHMNRVGPAGGATGLAIEHTSSILAGRKPDLESSRDAYNVACVLFGDAGRETVCRELGSLRNRIAQEPVAELADRSRRLLESLALR